jgi:drug/metabolite transporter (DMT)-like permease
MNWFTLALSATLLWSIVVYLDKFLIDKYLKNRGVGSLILFSSLFAGIIIPILAFINPDVLSIGTTDIFLLEITGVLSSVAIICYLYALEHEDTSLVVPFFQLIPVFALTLGYIFLGEIVTKKEILGGLIIVFGTFILSLEIEEEKSLRIKIKPLLLMCLASLLLASTDVLYKFISVGEDFFVTQFWHYVGLFLFGIALYIVITEYRKEFHRILFSSPKAIVGANVGGEILQVLANIINNKAILLVPVFLVTIVNANQPMIVFVIGMILTWLVPKVISEKISNKHLLHKGLAIFFIIIGSVVLYT